MAWLPRPGYTRHPGDAVRVVLGSAVLALTTTAIHKDCIGDREAALFRVVNDSAKEFEIRPSANRLPGLLFAPSPEPKQSKNRLHLDFRPEDQRTEVDRFLRAGARRVEIGQGTQPWIVLADPEGNEFCVLSPREP